VVAVVASGAKGSRQEKLYSFVVAAGFAADLLMNPGSSQDTFHLVRTLSVLQVSFGASVDVDCICLKRWE
jgi:hypothetical protein